MPTVKQITVAALRMAHLLSVAEYLRFVLVFLKNYSGNRKFLKENPGFRPPPSWWMNEAYGHNNYMRYALAGKADSGLIASKIAKYVASASPTVCEWGCGPGRVIRHLRTKGYQKLIGFDYNPKTIDWCRRNVDGIDFHLNNLEPPLNCPDQYFDALYCISVFTHLSREMHFAWIVEIQRVLKPEGLLIGTFHGDHESRKLLKHEYKSYEAGELVVRGRSREGGRLFVAFHPLNFMRNELLAGFEILEIQEQPVPTIGQTLYVCRKLGSGEDNEILASTTMCRLFF